MKRKIFVLLAVLLLNPHVPAQTPAPSAPTSQDKPATGDEVVRITTNLIQVDAIVTDKNGNLVTDLKPEDFEIQQDGRTQKITNFSFVSSASVNTKAAAAAATATGEGARVDKSAPPLPPVLEKNLRPEGVRRTIALVVDDLGLSLESIHFVRKALRKFVDEQMQPGDLVAVMRTVGGVGRLEQFTTDKRLLYAAIERIKWFPVGRGDDVSSVGMLPNETADARSAASIRELLDFRREALGVGTLNAVKFVIRGLKDLPGRKLVVLLSESFVLTTADGRSVLSSGSERSQRMTAAMNDLIDQANRASTVIYTINAGGLQTLGLTAADGRQTIIPELNLQTVGSGDSGGPPSVGPGVRAGVTQGEASLRNLDILVNSRRNQYFESQYVLDYLAEETGGLSIRNTNDISGGLGRMLDDQRGYYLLGYRPDDKTFEPGKDSPKLHKLEVKVKRPGLKVRSRNSFYGLTSDEALSPAARTPAEQLRGALTSPFASGDINVRLTSLFGNEPQAGSFMRSIIHVDARDLEFKQAADGARAATVELVAVTYDASGNLVDQITGSQTFNVRADAYERTLKDGFTSVLNVPVRRPGAYQLRVAVRDAASARLGSASQFVEVPDPKGRLALSGIVLTGVDQRAATTAAAPATMSGGEVDPQSGPAMRRLKQGMVMEYGYLVYTGLQAAEASKPAKQQLVTRMRLFRDGKQVFTGAEKPLAIEGQADPQRLVAGGRFGIGRDLAPGEYVLQVLVTDMTAKDKRRATATQWIDFEIVK